MHTTSQFRQVALAVIVLCLAIVTHAAVQPRQHDPELIKQYESQWLSREQTARDAATRVQLAKDLYAAAEATDDRAMKLLLLDMCWAWGNQDCPQGYNHAARAVQTIRTIAPQRRVECLERMAYLFKTAWERDRRKFLGNGIELANARMLIADQRLLDLCTQRSAGAISEAQFEAGLSQCKRDYVEAQIIAKQVLGVARGYSKSHPNAKARQALAAFVTDNQPLADRIEGGREDLLAFCVDYARRGDAALPEPIEKSTPVSTPTAVASAEPKPEPKVEPQPEPEPEPEPVVAVQPAEPAAPVVVSRRGGAFRQMRCEKCNDPFVPEFGSGEKICYWCKNELGFFRVEGE